MVRGLSRQGLTKVEAKVVKPKAGKAGSDNGRVPAARGGQAREKRPAVSGGARQEARLLEAIFDNCSNRMAYLDPQLKLLRVNAAFAAALGRRREELVGRSVCEVMPDHEVRYFFEQARDRGEAVELPEQPVRLPGRPEGGLTYWKWNLVPVKADDGGLQGLVFYGTEVTEWVHLKEQMLAAQRERASKTRLLEAIQEHAPNFLAYVDRELRFVQVNSGYATGLGYDQEELIGRSFAEVFADIPEFVRLLEYARDSGELMELREVHPPPTPPGSRPKLDPGYYDVTYTPVRDSAGKLEGTVISVLDVTEQVETRERLLEAARNHTRLAEQLMGEVNHRVKNNLAIVAGLLQMQAASQPEQSQVASMLREAVARIRTFAAIHEQLHELQPAGVEVELVDAVRRIAQIACEAFRRGNVEVEVTGAPVSYSAKTASTLCVVANELLTNAVKYGQPTENGKVQVKADVALQEGKLLFSVWNSNGEIPADFDVAQQSSLGLGLVYDIVAGQYEGTFSLRSEAGGVAAQVVIEEAKLRA